MAASSRLSTQVCFKTFLLLRSFQDRCFRLDLNPPSFFFMGPSAGWKEAFSPSFPFSSVYLVYESVWMREDRLEEMVFGKWWIVSYLWVLKTILNDMMLPHMFQGTWLPLGSSSWMGSEGCNSFRYSRLLWLGEPLWAFLRCLNLLVYVHLSHQVKSLKSFPRSVGEGFIDRYFRVFLCESTNLMFWAREIPLMFFVKF